MIRLGVAFRRLLHAIVSKYEYSQRYISNAPRVSCTVLRIYLDEWYHPQTHAQGGQAQGGQRKRAVVKTEDGAGVCRRPRPARVQARDRDRVRAHDAPFAPGARMALEGGWGGGEALHVLEELLARVWGAPAPDVVHIADGGAHAGPTVVRVGGLRRGGLKRKHDAVGRGAGPGEVELQEREREMGMMGKDGAGVGLGKDGKEKKKRAYPGVRIRVGPGKKAALGLGAPPEVVEAGAEDNDAEAGTEDEDATLALRRSVAAPKPLAKMHGREAEAEEPEAGEQVVEQAVEQAVVEAVEQAVAEAVEEAVEELQVDAGTQAEEQEAAAAHHRRRRRLLRRARREPMAPLRAVVTCLHTRPISTGLVLPLNPQDRKRHLRSMYAANGMSSPINAVCSARTPNYADRRDALYTYRDAGLYANDGDGAIYTGVRVTEDHLEDWFAGELTTTDLLDGAEVKTGHAGDWNVDQRILAEAAIHNAYIAMGAPRIVRRCLGACCTVNHREFFSLARIGGLRSMDRTIRAVLAHLGQTGVYCAFLPAPPGFETLHRELRRALTRGRP
ncbi:hypothetical protein FB451DRAFT_1412530 [Mycena latifolia]|nr:hypothetical protein FB451DRAFT_1412530 [Mycena latifolia]